MEYQVNAINIPSEIQIFLENFEDKLNLFVAGEINSHQQLGIMLRWFVVKRGDHFINVETNADFSIKDSLFVQSKIQGYLDKKFIAVR